MRKRLPYLLAFVGILVIEILIGAFVRDDFIRPFVGDVLVAALLCCLVKAVWPGAKRVSLWVFLFCALVEAVQLLDPARLLGLEGTLAQIILGATFDWKDILCYFLGCGAFAAITCMKRKN